jgi:hypothetical protein
MKTSRNPIAISVLALGCTFQREQVERMSAVVDPLPSLYQALSGLDLSDAQRKQIEVLVRRYYRRWPRAYLRPAKPSSPVTMRPKPARFMSSKAPSRTCRVLCAWRKATG